jgi:predicted CXXCH cytochrome family protein
MSFLLQRAVGRGLALNEVQGAVLRIGRGTSAELRSENPAVAFDHAVIERTEHGYVITDSGSITGTYVNGKPVETKRLDQGDLIEIGDLQITVQAANPSAPLFLRIASIDARIRGLQAEEDPDREAPVERGGVLRAKRFDFAGSYRLHRPFFSKLTVIAVLLLAAVVVIGEVTQVEQQKAFMPGGVSSAHSLAKDAAGNAIAERCAACHSPWNGVSNARCAECHGEATHVANVAERRVCEDCHHEHRGVIRLAEIPDTNCVRCHENLEAHMKVRNTDAVKGYGHITSFGGEHPDFTWPSDTNTLRFNHKLHLRASGVQNGSGAREVLECKRCHELKEWRRGFEPRAISFGTDCQSCHKLTFDARYPLAEAPHGGDPGLVYGFIVSTYSGNRDLIGKSANDVRRILATRPPSPPDERAIFNAEQVIKTRCALCHDVRRAGGRLSVVPPVFRSQWLDSGKFAHGPHRSVGCEDCHKPRESVNTSDVLMPVRENCTGCHGTVSTNASVRTARQSTRCIVCHDYHQDKTLMMRRRVDS